MIVLGFDTATLSTTVGLRLADGSSLQARDDPGPGEHPGHATRLLAMTRGLLADAGMAWTALDRVAVGLGPGRFTGLRVGVATARGLAQSLSIELVGVSTLQALAEAAATGGEEEPEGVLAVIDARRGEAFAAACSSSDQEPAGELAFSRALRPEDLQGVVEQAERRGGGGGKRWLAVGDGAVRFRGALEAAGVAVAPDSSPLHLVNAAAICDLGARAEPVARYEQIVPDYRRRPDAEIARDVASARQDSAAREAVAAHEGAAALGGGER
ncbi:MAG: tRNA (adenosine(37)-N6)-threonylcarbamoyltransferase complex dimerization subunit type 1 TsaB [Solirubrobacterales bacterium]